MSSSPVEKRFAVLCQITRAQHFAWREAVARSCPDLDVTAVVNTMWEIVGIQTGDAYVKHLDCEKPLPAQLAQSFAWSSASMGEDARAENGANDSEAFVRHHECPWYHWHTRLGLLDEDRPGCDRWFSSVIDAVNRALGTALRVETLKSLPDGDDCCLRRISS